MSTVLFAGGGTGGHIFPGIAVAEALRERRGGRGFINTGFLCSERPGDSRILEAQGERFWRVPARPFGLSPRTLFTFVRAWGASVKACRVVIRGVRADGPVVLAAMGGFVAAPAARAAVLEGCPILLINLDAVAGRANRWIAGRATRVLTTAGGEGGRVHWTGIRPIVRKSARAPMSREDCKSSWGLSPDAPTLLVTGASLGAQTINEFLGAFVQAHGAELRLWGWQFIHQTGGDEATVAEMKKKYEAARLNCAVVSFSPDMGRLWGAADAAVSRAGAGNVAEVWANRVPTLFMPYPFHADEHQRLNAAPLEAAGAAELGRDEIDAAKNLKGVGPVLLEMMSSAEIRTQMRQNFERLGDTDGAEIAAEFARELLL